MDQVSLQIVAIKKLSVSLAVWVALALGVVPLNPAQAKVRAVTHVRRDELVVRVVSYGGVTWGRVDVYYESGGHLRHFHTCARRRCYMYPVHGAQLFFRETPRNKRQWRFRAWIVRNEGRTLHIHHPTLRLRVLGHLHNNVQWYRARVKANYIYP